MCISSFYKLYTSLCSLQTVHNQIIEEYHKIKQVNYNLTMTDVDGMNYRSILTDCNYMLFVSLADKSEL